jgi:putative SOS response-associated peptidase YedK
VSAIHPKAMPVILTTPDKVEAWMTAPPDEALKLQRPLPDRALRIVARGVKEDAAEAAWAAFEGKTKRFDSLF